MAIGKSDDWGELWKLSHEVGPVAKRFRSSSAHLLLAVIQADGVGRAVLERLGAHVPAIVTAAEAAIESDPSEGVLGEQPRQDVFQRAAEEAHKAGRAFFFADYALLGMLLTDDDPAGAILKQAGLEADRLRAVITAVSQEFALAEAAELATSEVRVEIEPGSRAVPEPLDLTVANTSPAAKLVLTAFSLLDAGDLSGHLDPVDDEVVYGDGAQVALGKGAYVARFAKYAARAGREEVIAPKTLDVKRGPLQVVQVIAADNAVEWVSIGKWLESEDEDPLVVKRSWSGYRVAVLNGRITEVHAPRHVHGQRSDYEDWLHCARCGVRLPEGSPTLLCAEHAVEREWRQRELVPAEAMSHAWCDSLATLRDRPPGLADEPNPHDFWLARSTRVDGERPGFLVFARYVRSRYPDLIVIDKETGEFRRYVESSYEEAVADASGERTARPETQEFARWGSTEPRDWRRRFSILRSLLPFPGSWDEFAERATPTYGLVFRSYGLSSSGRSGNDDAWTLQYRSEDQPSVSLSVTSRSLTGGRHAIARMPTGDKYDPDRDSWWAILQGRVPFEPGITDRSPLRLTLDGRAFEGELLRPRPGSQERSFMLRASDVAVYGVVTGLAEPAVVALLESMVNLNSRVAELERLDEEVWEERLRKHPEITQQMELVQANRKPDPVGEAPLPLLEQVRRIAPSLLGPWPGACLTRASASFEQGWPASRRAVIEPRIPPYRWHLGWWGGPTDREMVGQKEVLQGEWVDYPALPGMSPGPRPHRRRGDRSYSTIYPIFALTDLQESPIIDSDAAFKRFLDEGGDEYCRTTGAKLAVVELEADEEGRKVWGARFQRTDTKEYLVILLDATTGSLLLAQRSTLTGGLAIR